MEIRLEYNSRKNKLHFTNIKDSEEGSLNDGYRNLLKDKNINFEKAIEFENYISEKYPTLNLSFIKMQEELLNYLK